MLVVVDLENTISNASDRLWLLKYKGTSKVLIEQYDLQFQEGFIDDYINMNVKLFIDSLVKKGYAVVILTAKLEKYRQMVVEWLLKYKVKYDVLVMKQDDNISDLEFKEKYIILNKTSIDFALDDVGAVCAMFGEHNIPCLRIEQK